MQSACALRYVPVSKQCVCSLSQCCGSLHLVSLYSANMRLLGSYRLGSKRMFFSCTSQILATVRRRYPQCVVATSWQWNARSRRRLARDDRGEKRPANFAMSHACIRTWCVINWTRVRTPFYSESRVSFLLSMTEYHSFILCGACHVGHYFIQITPNTWRDSTSISFPCH